MLQYFKRLFKKFVDRLICMQKTDISAALADKTKLMERVEYMYEVEGADLGKKLDAGVYSCMQ